MDDLRLLLEDDVKAKSVEAFVFFIKSCGVDDVNRPFSIIPQNLARMESCLVEEVTPTSE